DRARPDAARHRRDRGLPPHPCLQRRLRADADREGGGSGQDRRALDWRRRLPDQAVLARRAGRPGPRAASPPSRRRQSRRRPGSPFRLARARSASARGTARRRPVRAPLRAHRARARLPDGRRLMRSPLRRSLIAKLLAAQLAVIVAGSTTLALVSLLLGPTLYRRHVSEALGIVPPTVLHHLDEAFGQSLALSLAVGIAAAALAAVVVSWALSSRVVRPVRALAAAARDVSRGNYSARVSASGEDEITVLARAFNEMAGALASAEERRRRLLADLAHELRTPLATLDAHLEGLADGIVAPEPQTWQLLRAQTARL